MSSTKSVDKSDDRMEIPNKNRLAKNSFRSDSNIHLSSKDKRALYNLKAIAKMMKNNEKPPKIDEIMLKEIGSNFDLLILFQSLKQRGHMMLNEVRQDYTSKHFSAICGCYVEEMDRRPSSAEAVNESVNLQSSMPEAKILVDSDETPSPPRHCRYCKSNVDVGNVTCDDCRSFLSDFCLNLDRLEHAFCIKVPMCITTEGPDSSRTFPSSWCKACRILHCVNLGFRPHSSHKRKSKHRNLLNILYPSRLSQDKYIFWARNQRCVEYFATRLKLPITIETHSSCELAPFFDRLWCRALPSNSSRSPADVPNIESSPKQSCQFCSNLCSGAYGITLGPSPSPDHPEVKVCGPCILRCRITAVRVAEQTSSEEGDPLAKWYSASDFLSLCECSALGAKCDFCFTANSVTILRDQLMSSADGVFGEQMIPLGSPLFFGCCRPLPEVMSPEDKNIESRLTHDNLPCVVCQKTSGNIFQLNNKTIVCEDCVLGFKTVLTLLSIRAKDKHLSDLVLLANLVVLPCKAHHPTNQAPLWAICLQCHARRCLRLLHPLEPSLNLPSWLKRRARLVFYRASTLDKTITICDLDPTMLITTRRHKRSKRLCIVTDSAARENVLKNVGTSPLLLEDLTIPVVDEAQSTFIADESSASSLYSGSESESEHEEKENEVDNATEASNAPQLPKEEVGSAGLRDRRSRRLTARYAEALKTQTTKRRRPKDDSESAGGTLRSLSSPAVTNSTIGEEDEENPSRYSRPPKRLKMAESPEIIEGKRKPKANVRLLGDFATLGPQGKWESGGVVYSNLDDVRSDISSVSAQIRSQNRRQQTVLQTGRSGPRVKMVNRRPPPSNQLNSPMSIMKHAAKLAAVGAQKQDGTSPFMAASTATAEAYLSDTSSADGGNRLKADCGNCAACRGLATPCGRCVNCRKQAHYGGVGSSLKNRPCIVTICQRRRHLMSRLEGPRVKIPSKFLPRFYQKSKVSPRSVPVLSGLALQPSLFETVPGLEDQIMNIASPLLRCDSPSSRPTKATESDDQASAETNSPTNPVFNYPTRSRDVYAGAPVRSLRGGDLGMFFESRDSTNEDMALRSVVPVEGEVIDANTAHRGGFPVITTAAAAPPKEICYLCGSAGVELQYCKVCAEPYHAFCDRFQTITKGDKENFVCSNCIPCEVCNFPGVELRCSRCLRGYHPICLSDYAPYRNGDKCKFICPHCAECVHCLVSPFGDYPEKIRPFAEKEIVVPWSRNPAKCMDCVKAESKGDICPVCDRAYGSQPLELIRCDSCGQWMHTACAQFSLDQFELMRLFPKQLRKYIILCTTCEPNAERFRKANKSGKKQLCQLMCTALTMRMNALVDACGLPPTGDTYHYSQPSAALATDRRSFSSIPPMKYTESHRFIYQTDGIDDDYAIKEEDEEEEEYEELEEDLSPMSHAVNDTNRESYTPSWLMHHELTPPPARAEWLLEKLGSDFWITPKTLAFMLLARVIARIERTPPSSNDYMQLRRLLNWLATSIQILFPWLDSSASVREVRGLLHQRHGSLFAVEEFLRSAAEIELYELACPFVTALTSQIRRVNVYQANQSSPPRKLGFYQTCIDKVRKHVLMHHPDFASYSRKFDTAQEAFTKLRSRNERCCQPTLLSNIPDEVVTDATDEALIANFQKELFLKWQRLLHCSTRRVVLSALLDDNKMPYYFCVKSNWESLSKAYASQMVPIPSKSSVDLDESDSETPDRKIKALPEEIIDREEKAMFDLAVEPRRCLLCARNTDTSIEDRLIYIGSDTWVHVNCALWSKEVFEEDSGQLTGLSAALRRGSRSYCRDCGRPGATMTCSNADFCDVVVHFPCAMSRWRPTHSEPIFTAGRCFFCSPECYATVKATRLLESIKRLRMKKLETLYKDEEELMKEKAAIKEDTRKLDDLIVDWEITQAEVNSIRSEVDWEMTSPELREMLVYRRVFVPSDCFIVSLRDGGFDLEAQNYVSSSDENDDNVQDAYNEKRPGQSVLSLATSKNTFAFASYKLPASAFVITIGALCIDRLGYIAEASDSLCREKYNYLCPVGYRARRFFWSTVDPNVRTPYILTINQAQKESVKSENPPAISQHSLMSASRSKAFSAKRTMQSPIAPKPTIPVARSPPSSAFDPYPNDRTGLPLIRFTYPQGIPPSRQIQRASASSQQSSTPTPQNRVITASPQRVVLQAQPSVPVQSISPVQSVSITPMISPTSKPVNIINTSSGSLFTSIASNDQKGQSLIVTKPSGPVAAPKFTNVLFPPRASTPRIVGAVSLSRSPGQQTPITTTTMPYSSASRISTSGTTTVVQIPTPVNVIQKRTAIQAQLSPPPTSTGKRPVNVYQHISTGSVPTASPGVPQSPRQSIIIRTPVLNPPGAIGPALRPVRIFTSKSLCTISTPERSPPSIVTSSTPPGPLAHRLIRPPITPQVVRQSGMLTVLQPPRQPSESQDQKHENPSQGAAIKQLDGMDDSDEFVDAPQRRGSGARQKRKWMTDRESRRALQECVQKARQVANERMYQKEVALFANSFQLVFSARPSKEVFFNPTSVWRDVVNAVAESRKKRDIPFSGPPFIDGWAQFGLNHRHVIFLLEQLPGAHTCLRYHFRYHRYRIDQIREKYEPPQSNIHGAARLIPFMKDPKRSEMARDPLEFLLCKTNRAPRSCLPLDWPSDKNGRTRCPDDPPSSTIGTSRWPSACIDAARQAASIVADSLNISPRLHARTVEAVVAEATADMVEEAEAGRSKQLLSLAHQLRNIPTNREARMWRVAVCPSRIHKRGLFALCSFRPGELICEYTGELVTNMVCDRREAMYRSKGVDCYFFRVSENLVVDATYAGNYARFINHSCQPNCRAQIVGKNHIVIIANRRILPGEELTYDYQFPKEMEKLICNCGRIGCKRYLN